MSDESNNRFGYDLIRNEVLRHLLGPEHDNLLYWVGKTLAREKKLASLEEVVAFFDQSDWGKLERVKEKRSEYIFELSGEWMGRKDDTCYQLEAGFLAETFEVWHELSTAVTYSDKRGSVLFTVHMDRNDPLSIEKSDQ